MTHHWLQFSAALLIVIGALMIGVGFKEYRDWRKDGGAAGLPPGYGYPSRNDWQRINAENLGPRVSWWSRLKDYFFFWRRFP